MSVRPAPPLQAGIRLADFPLARTLSGRRLDGGAGTAPLPLSPPQQIGACQIGACQIGACQIGAVAASSQSRAGPSSSGAITARTLA
jgi:hypothetical protein